MTALLFLLHLIAGAALGLAAAGALYLLLCLIKAWGSA